MRVAELGQRLGLDLADALAGDAELRPTSSSVRAWPSSRPNRRRTTCCSRSLSSDRASLTAALSIWRAAFSAGCSACWSSMKSERFESSASPTGESSESGSWAIRMISRTR